MIRNIGWKWLSISLQFFSFHLSWHKMTQSLQVFWVVVIIVVIDRDDGDDDDDLVFADGDDDDNGEDNDCDDDKINDKYGNHNTETHSESGSYDFGYHGF